MANKLPSAGLSAGCPRVSTGPGRTLKAVVAAGLTAGMVAIAAPAVSHVPERCMPRLVAMIGAETAANQYRDTAKTVVRIKTAEKLTAASKAEILDQMTGVAEWTVKLMELDNKAYLEVAAFSRCMDGE